MNRSRELLELIEKSAAKLGRVNIMEVCGTHTMAIAKAGIKSLLPKNIRLLSGPGCPVCVTPAEEIDQALSLCDMPDTIVCSYGDMLRVPGSTRGDSLASRRAKGADVRMVYSPMDALDIAGENRDKQIVFLGVGFETTAPGTACAVKAAKERGIDNFSVLSLLKRVEPALRALAADDDFSVNALLCPGHVATIIGEAGFRYVPEELKLSAVIAGFESEDILLAIWRLLLQLEHGEARVENMYPRAVRENGNPLALEAIDESFDTCAALWRGMGKIENSAYVLRGEYAAWDARRVFGLKEPEKEAPSACRCGDVIRGACEPEQCPFFAVNCTPSDPIGPCMVSGEGSCAARARYGG